MKPVTVSRINEYIAKKLTSDLNLRNIAVIGEISGLSRRGHVYFSLKDENSILRAVIWQSSLRSMDQELLRDGRMIVAVGSISPYARGGYYSFQIHYIEDAGIGKAAQEFERLRKKLEAEGLFDASHKKPLPPFPKTIGIITSTEGDALRDIRKIILKKNNIVDLLIFPAFVQGVQAPESLTEGIRTANRVNREEQPIDLLIIGRGGGSREDLDAFNDEGLARAIYESEIPVISAVGHETNFSISDFVADRRAETPTAAADMAVPDTEELRTMIDNYRTGLLNTIAGRIASDRRYLSSRKELLEISMIRRLGDAGNRIDRARLLLREGNPNRVIERGFAVVMEPEGEQVLPDLAAIRPGDTVRIRMRDGSFLASVTDIRKEESHE